MDEKLKEKLSSASDNENRAKRQALSSLVAEGVLTPKDFSACIRAIERTSMEKGPIYRDKFITVDYRGYEKSQMLGGSGFKVHLIIENKTQSQITIRARTLVNGVIVEKDELISSDIPERSKIIASASFFYDKLKPLDIKTIQDVEEISFLFRCIGEQYKEINKAKRMAKIML